MSRDVKRPLSLADTLLIVITLVIGVARPSITPRLDIPTANGSYEAFAHLFVGGLIGAWLVRRDKRLWLWLAITVSLFELGIFLVQKRAS